MSRPHWVCPRSRCVCFPCLHCLGSRLLCQELSEASPGLYALPRSKPLRFRYSGTPQRRRISWACILCPSQVWAAQVTRCLACAVPATYHLPRPCRSIFGVYNQRILGVRVSLLGSWSLAATLLVDVYCPESQEVLVSNKACLQFGRWCPSGAAIALFELWLPSPACLQLGGGPVHSQLALLSPLFCEQAWWCLRLGLFMG